MSVNSGVRKLPSENTSSGRRSVLNRSYSIKPVISKVETFLKRTLPPEDLIKVRTYESCVIKDSDDGGNPVSKYVIVTNSGIFTTDNPHPKSLVLTVDLTAIVSVDLVSIKTVHIITIVISDVL
ncbi:unnamed protein product, partial [Notodromas monacha]